MLVSPNAFPFSPFGVAERDLVSVAGTKHYCLTAVNRYGALCCPDFPQRAGLKHACFSSEALSDRPINCGAVYGNRTRLLGLGSRCTTDVLTPQNIYHLVIYHVPFGKTLQNYYFFLTYASVCAIFLIFTCRMTTHLRLFP